MTVAPCGAAAPWRSATTRRTAASSAPRASSQVATWLAIALTPPGSTRTLPTVATHPCRVAAARVARTRAACLSIASSRSSRRVVPAWLAVPGTSIRHRPCGQMSLPTPTAEESGRMRRDRPGRAPARRAARRRCSTRRERLGVVADWSTGRGPRRRWLRPSSCRRRRSGRGRGPRSSAPVMMRDPAHAIPNRAPSSSPKQATANGTRGRSPASRSASTAASAETTPSGPSNAPPSGTESRCEPTATPPVDPSARTASGSPHQAHWLPARSSTRSSPRAAHCPANHSRSVWSSRVHAYRRYPPVEASRPTGESSAHIASKERSADTGTGTRECWASTAALTGPT